MAYLVDRKFIIDVDDEVLVSLVFPGSEILEIR